MIDVTVLLAAAQGLADTLQAKALEAGYDFETCVTPVEPAVECETINVWLAGIEPTVLGKCVIAPIVTFRWSVAVCVGVDIVEGCDFWAEGTRTSDVYGALWAVYAGLIKAYLPVQSGGDGTLCVSMGVLSCEDVRVGRVDQWSMTGDTVAYSGLVTARLDVVDVAS